jgi:hypothetical protein
MAPDERGLPPHESGGQAMTLQALIPNPSPIARRETGVLPNALWGEGGGAFLNAPETLSLPYDL